MPARTRAPTKDSPPASTLRIRTGARHSPATLSRPCPGWIFDDYIERNIYQPLGMASSSFREPLPPGLRERMSQGYRFKNGEFEKHDFEFIHNFGPAGSMSTTATDMAKFMLAHLNDGALGDARILKPETAQLMHAGRSARIRRSAAAHSDSTRPGSTAGAPSATAAIPFSSIRRCCLVPEENLFGVFVSFNTCDNAGFAAVDIARAVVKHVAPAELPVLKVRADAEMAA